jgi:hypothetical protein
MRTWDVKKKKFVTNFVGGDPYKKQRNEAGELVAPTSGALSLLFSRLLIHTHTHTHILIHTHTYTHTNTHTHTQTHTHTHTQTHTHTHAGRGAGLYKKWQERKQKTVAHPESIDIDLGQDEPEGGTGEVAAPVSSKRSGFGTDASYFHITLAHVSKLLTLPLFKLNTLPRRFYSSIITLSLLLSFLA